MKSPHCKQILFLAGAVGIISVSGCTLSASFQKVEGSCTIPDSTTITSECCSAMQRSIEMAAHHVRPSQQEQAAMKQSCSSFSKYVMGHMPHDPGANPEQHTLNMINAMPDGLTCTEKVKGGGESACELNAKRGKLAVTCEIPKETTITSECCKTIQNDIDRVQAQPNVPPSVQEQQEAMKKCSSLQTYGMKLMSQAHSPNAINSLPSGLSCTETTSSGNMLSLYANRTIISAISLAAGVDSKDLGDTAGVMPSLVSGIAGFLAGGTFVAGVLLRYSKKEQGNQQALLG